MCRIPELILLSEETTGGINDVILILAVLEGTITGIMSLWCI